MALQEAVRRGNLAYIESHINTDKWFVETEYSDYILLNMTITNGHLNIAKFLIDHGCRLNKINTEIREDTPLHNAVSRNYFELVNSMIHKASLTAKNVEGDTPLHIAFKKNFNNIVYILLTESKHLYLVNDYGLSTLHIVCTTDRELLARRIWKKHNLNISSRISDDSPYYPGFTPLHFAIQNSKLEFVTWLVKAKADVNVADAKNSRPLFLAFDMKEIDILDVLLTHPDVKKFNHVNEKGVSYLHIASAQGDIKVVKAYLQSTLNVNAQVHENHQEFAGYSAIHFAAVNGHQDIFELLMQNGADFRIGNFLNETPLYLAYSKKHYEIVDKALSIKSYPLKFCMHMFDINPTNINGLSHFHIACERNRYLIVKEFIDSKFIDINAQINENATTWPGYTPLHIAIECKHVSIVKMLLEAGANCNLIVNVTGMTSLHLACRLSGIKKVQVQKPYQMKKRKVENVKNDTIVDESQKEMIKLLLEHNAKLDIQDKQGKTIFLHLYRSVSDASIVEECSSECLDEVVKIHNSFVYDFINRKANVHTADNDGLTLLHLLASSQLYNQDIYNMVDYLIKIKVDVNAKTVENKTPLFIASKLWHMEPVISLLLDNGADSNIADNKKLATPFHNYLSSFVYSPVGLKLLKKFIDCGADISLRKRNGRDALLVIFSKSKPSIYCKNEAYYNINHTDIAPIFTLDCDLNVQDRDGKTALHYAYDINSKEDVKFLLSQGADIDIMDEDGSTPLTCSLIQNREALKILISHVEILNETGCYLSDIVKNDKEYMKERFRCLWKEELNSESAIKKEQEFDNLKSIKIDIFTSFYDLLFKRDYELIYCAKNLKLREAISAPGFDKKFPFYGSIIKRQFKKGLSQNSLRDKARESLLYITNHYLPDICNERILHYLNNEDLRQLIYIKYSKFMKYIEIRRRSKLEGGKARQKWPAYVNRTGIRKLYN